MQTAPLITYPYIKCWTSNEHFGAGYKLYTYKANTTTPADTWSDRLLTVLNTNPIVLDSVGEAIVYVDQPIKLVFTTPTGGAIWTRDYLGELPAQAIEGAATAVTINNNYVVTAVPAPLAMTDRMTLIMTPDVDSKDTITSTVFTGTGINDLTTTGPYIGTTAGSIITAQIDSISSAIKLLLHGDGSGATFTDSSLSARAITAAGNATQSSTQSKFSGKSIALDGTGDYVSAADSDDWTLGDEQGTIEFWVWHTSVTNAGYISQYADANNHWYIDYDGTSIRFYYKDASTARASYAYTWAPSVDTWYHIRLVVDTAAVYLYIDGTKITWTTTTTAISTNTLGGIAGTLVVGYTQGSTYLLTGYVEEVVFHKGVALSTGASFTLATTAYTASDADTIKWKKDGGAWTTLVPITAALQILIENVGVTFAVKTGHTINDLWAITLETPTRINLNGLGNYLVYKNVNGTLEALGAGDLKANYPAFLIFSLSQSAWILANPAAPALSTSFVSAIRYRKTLGTNYTLTLGDQGYELFFTGSYTLTLLNCADFASRFFYVSAYGASTITINSVDSQLIWIPGASVGATSITMPLPGICAIQLESNGVDWHIITTATIPAESLIYHEANNGVTGTTVNAATWTLLGVNTKEDPGNMVSAFAGSLFTLIPGSYLIEATVPIWAQAVLVTGKLRLTNVTASTHQYGLSQHIIGYYDGGATYLAGGNFEIKAKVNITSASQFGLYLYTNINVVASKQVSFGVVERYTTIKIVRAI